MVVAGFSLMATTTFKRLQGHQVTVAMQRLHLASLQTALLHAVGRRDSLSEMEAVSV